MYTDNGVNVRAVRLVYMCTSYSGALWAFILNRLGVYLGSSSKPGYV